MKIEIWSDVVCPFCYIGKRKFEKAWTGFAHKESVAILWKSYQLDPDMPDDYAKSTYELISEKYAISLEESVAMHAQVTQTAKEAGLVYHFEKAIPANTLKAHQLIQFAKTKEKQEEAEEVLFRSYFTEGRNINDLNTLLEIGETIGLEKIALKEALENGTYIPIVMADQSEAQQIGVRGVPFFIMNRKYAVSGAQDSTVFLEVLEKAFAEWRTENHEIKQEVIEGNSCTPGKKCD
ncbi:DsbA family oxidoreductase [Flavobacterium humi]|uniref:DsbA family oxidoreductase n=2 Tax=Flavobacterium humi TaxID=2562683 RepID=A0A4Z0LDE7_9FLAO|nr:DsbA family oxidoreductase [Flavobacterium humi]